MADLPKYRIVKTLESHDPDVLARNLARRTKAQIKVCMPGYCYDVYRDGRATRVLKK